jgi:hypothetical protein
MDRNSLAHEVSMDRQSRGLVEGGLPDSVPEVTDVASNHVLVICPLHKWIVQ